MPIISNLPSLTVGTGTAYVPVVDTTGGTEVTKKASFDVIADYVIGTFGSINQASSTDYGLVKVGTTLQINTLTGVLNVADSPTWVSQRLSGSIAATSPNTGTLVVQGGVGIGEKLYVGDDLNIEGNTLTHGVNGDTVGNFYVSGEAYYLAAPDPAGGVNAGQNLWIGRKSNTGSRNIRLGISGYANAYPASEFTVYSDKTTILGTDDASSTVTGALQVVGGIGVGGNVYVGGNLLVDGFPVSTSTYSLPIASPSILGGIKIGPGLLIDGNGVVTANTATNPTPSRYIQVNSAETQNFVSSGEFFNVPGTTNTSGMLINRGSIGGDINAANAAGVLYSDAAYWNNGFTTTRGTFVFLSALKGSSLTFDGIRAFPGTTEFNVFGSDNTGTVLSLRGHTLYHTLVTEDFHIPNKKYVDLKSTTATTIVQGTVKVGDNLTILSGVLSVATATNSIAGVVKAGTGLTADIDGTLSLNLSTTSTLGGVIVGSGLTVDGGGVISVSNITSNLIIKDESVTLTSTATSINFVGGGVTAVASGNDITVTISGGGFSGGAVANSTQFNDTTQSTGTTTGAVTIAGGLGVGGSIYAGNIYSNGNLLGVGGGGTPGGSSNEVQFRYQGTFGASPQFTFNSSTNVLAVTAINANTFSSNSGGAPTIASTSTLTLEASTASRVVVSQSPIKLASYSTAARNNITAQNGDLIYNTDTNKFQGYANGTWVDLN